MNIENTKKNRPYLIIDGMNVFIRHFLVNGTVNSKSELVGGVVGFLRFMNHAIDIFSPSKVFVVWESGGGSAKRKSIYKDYKANRGKIKEFKKLKSGSASMKDSLKYDHETRVKQLTQLYRLLSFTPACQVFVSGTECDDVVSYIATQYFRTDKTDKIIVSNDKDFYQLLEDETITIYDHSKREIVDGNAVYKKFGIAPRNFCMARSMVGDPSDNIDGVIGVGLKTVLKRFPEVSDRTRDIDTGMILQECVKQINNKAKQKTFKQVKESEDIIRRNWRLMTLSPGMLSAKEIAKINYIIENHEPKMNKVSLIKEVISSGLTVSFDFENLASQMRSLMTF